MLLNVLKCQRQPVSIVRRQCRYIFWPSMLTDCELSCVLPSHVLLHDDTEYEELIVSLWSNQDQDSNSDVECVSVYNSSADDPDAVTSTKSTSPKDGRSSSSVKLSWKSQTVFLSSSVFWVIIVLGLVICGVCSCLFYIQWNPCIVITFVWVNLITNRWLLRTFLKKSRWNPKSGRSLAQCVSSLKLLEILSTEEYELRGTTFS